MLTFPARLIAAIPASFATDYSTNWLAFIANKSRYTADVEEAAKAGKHVLFFDWGGNVMIGVNRAVVWDAEDQVALPKAQRTHIGVHSFQRRQTTGSFKSSELTFTLSSGEGDPKARLSKYQRLGWRDTRAGDGSKANRYIWLWHVAPLAPVP